MLLQYGIYSMAEKRDNEESINFMLDISRSLYNSFDKNLIMMVWKNYYYSKGLRIGFYKNKERRKKYGIMKKDLKTKIIGQIFLF